jgi:hypothetical protein
LNFILSKILITLGNPHGSSRDKILNFIAIGFIFMAINYRVIAEHHLVLLSINKKSVCGQPSKKNVGKKFIYFACFSIKRFL